MDYWKCPKCLGTGKIIHRAYGHGQDTVGFCPKCDGTGNSLVDGEARAHQRAVDEIERRQTSKPPMKRREG